MLAFAAAATVYARDGREHFLTILLGDVTLFGEMLPKVLAGCLIGAFVTLLLPREMVARWVGHESGFMGLLIAAFFGFLLPGGPITIYPVESPALAAFEDAPERWLDVRWDMDDNARRFPARLAVQSVNEPGSLAQIAQVIAEHDGNIDNIRMERKAPDFTSLTIDLEVYDLKHLTSIIAQLRAKTVVAGVERVMG